MRNFGHVEDGKVGSISDFQLWRRIFTLMSKHSYWLILAVILSFLVTASILALPYLMQQGIDKWIMPEHLEKAVRLHGIATTSYKFILFLILAFLAAFFQVITLEWVGQSVMHRIRQKLYFHVINLDLTFLHSQPTGRLVTRLTNDIQNMHEMFTSVLVTLFNDLLRIIGVLCLLFFMNVKLAAMMSIFLPVAAVITYLFSRLAREHFSAIRSQLSAINSFLGEAISGISVIQLFGQQDTNKQHFNRLSNLYLDKCLRQIRLFGIFLPLTEALAPLAMAIILWYGGKQVMQVNLTIGELMAFLAYMRLFFQPLRELSQKYSIVQSAMASAERIFQLLDRENGIDVPQIPHKPEKFRGEIKFENICFSYNQDEQVIKDLSLAIAPGKTIALVGTTGSGKSTLIKLLIRFFDPDSGTISLDGVDIKKYALEDLRSHIGVVLQDTYLLQDTLFANIVIDSQTEKETVLSLLNAAGMERFLERLPDGLDTIIGEGGHELSTGEKQLLSFARILFRNPGVLILDEATASIDTESEDILERVIEKTFKDKTSIIIAHRLSTIRRADYIAVMHQGQIVESGSHDELLDNNGFYASMVTKDNVSLEI